MHFFSALCLFMIAAAAFGCSKSTSTTGSNSNLDSNQLVAGTTASNQNSQTIIPGIQGAPAEGNRQAANQLNVPVKHGSSTEKAPSSMPAPDDSTFSAELTDIAREVRTFKSHPQLLKVEKTIEPGKQPVIKVFLRGGKIVTLPGDKITNLASVPASSILSAAGINPPPQSSVPGKDPAAVRQ